MDYSAEAAAEVRRLAAENLRWKPSDNQVARVIALASTSAHLASVVGQVYRDRFASI